MEDEFESSLRARLETNKTVILHRSMSVIGWNRSRSLLVVTVGGMATYLFIVAKKELSLQSMKVLQNNAILVSKLCRYL